MEVVRYKILLAVILIPIVAAAQYRFDSWTTDNGLPQNTVRAVTQTPDGYIWFTTSDGLVRFDGVKFSIFSKSNSQNFPTNRLLNVLAAKDGTLWISTENAGVIRYRNGVFKTFTTADGLVSDTSEVASFFSRAKEAFRSTIQV
jgi:ligand-binding sensor domain-containing protein